MRVSSATPASRAAFAQGASGRLTPPPLHASNLVKRYGQRPVLEGVALRVASGAFVAVLGRSGSGKSTLVHVLAGIQQPDAGQVWIRGTDITSLGPIERAEYRLRNIGVVFQHFNLIPDLTVLENVMLPLQLAHVSRTLRRERGQALLSTFGLAALADRFPDVLSGGELQRVAVARALAPRPAIILADEPTGNLDEENARGVVEAFSKAAQAGAAVLVATHDSVVSDAARTRYRILDGRLRLVA